MDTYYATCPKFHCFVSIHSVHRIQHERFCTKQHGYRLWYLSLDLSGNIAVSGDNYYSRRTYIDLYESGNNSDSRDKLKLFYSKEFEKYSNYRYRYVSFLDKNVSKLVTCIGDKIEIIDTKNESKVIRSCRVNGETTCLAVREGEIFIGLDESQTVLVFNNDLKETKKIRIKGIKDGDYPCDLQVIKDTVFVCTATRQGIYDRALSLSVYDSSTVSEYTDTTGMYGHASSIAVSEKMNLVAVVWGVRRIIVYSLNKNKSFLVFDVDNDVTRIRISDRYKMIITGNRGTGEIKLYDLEQLFTFEAMKRTLAYVVSPEECEELRKYFGVTEEEIQRRLEAGDEDESKKLSDKEKTVRKMECLLTVIEEKGHLNPSSIDKLTDAVSRLGDEICISDLKGPMEGYSLHSSKLQITMEESMTRQKAWEDKRNHLSSKLETAESKVKKHEKTLDNLRDQLMQAQEQEKTFREDLKDGELKIKELEGERMALTEELGQIKTLTEELEQTKKRKTESDRQIQTLTEELKQSKTESDIQIETLTEELKQSKTESDIQIETLTKELKQTKQSKTESDIQIETLTEELKQSKTESDRQIKTLRGELKQSKTESHEKLETLTVELNETKQKLLTKNKELEITSKDLKMTKQTLKETAHDRDNIKTELQQYRLDFAKESKALKEVLNQAKEAMAEHQKISVEDKPLVDSEETGDEGGAILAAEFGRLTVAIADHLTLDQCLMLANFFKIPTSDCYTMLPVSFSESPGMRLLDVLKKRKVINIFDVTNLQKALAELHLEAVNHDLVVPYQEKIDEEQHELHKVEEMYTWEEVNAAKDRTAQRQIRDSQTSPIDDTKPEYASQTEATAQHTETGDEGRGSFLEGRHHHQLYTEHSIGREGGTIQLANVSLRVPPDALHESHVIALSVMNESPFPLDREVDMARMTPLVKLEPLGLKFTKPLQLNIPHSALISEPDNHDVIIYSGQIEDSSDSIRWTEERSVPRQLKEKSVTVDIQCLTYLSASLVSHTASPPLYIVRAVPFVDGVRNTDDDIILTICFCNDNDTEYNMLLSDYKTKLPMEQYSTIQLCRQLEKDGDDAGFLNVTVTSRNNSYVPDADQAVKLFPISHLCTASRVSHQLRLQKNKKIDRDDVQVLLKFSQAGRTPTEIFMKARIKDLMISQESEELLIGSVSTALKPYNELKANVSSMLENCHCRKLATYFELTRAESERVTTDASPGRMLLKILDEREKIMPQKMFGFYQGLKECHLDKIARLVFEYIEKNSNETQQEKHENDNDKSVEGFPEKASVSQRPLQKLQKTSTLSHQSVQTTLSSSCVSSDVHVKTLTNEGYTEHEVVEALDISRNRLVMARKVLQCLVEQSDVSPTKGFIFLHKEQYIDENGGEIVLREANVHLLIPVGAVSKGSIVSLTMMTSKQGNVPSEGRMPQLSPVIKFGPEGATLNKVVTLRIPHCASETEGIISADILLGFSSNEEEIQWRKRKQHEPAPSLKKEHFEVYLQTFCAITPNITVDFKKPLEKKLRVLPLINRVTTPSDDLILTLWIYNDDETEHMNLLHGECNVRGKMQLHDFKRFTLKGSEKDKEVHIKSDNNNITSYQNINMEKVISTTLWHNTRHAAQFHFQNKEGISDISFTLRLCTRQLRVRAVVDLQFDVKVTLSELLQKPQESVRALLTAQEPQPAMEKSFQELVSKLSSQLDVDSCLEMAGIFRLSSDLKDRVKKSSEPGKVIFDELIQEQLITAASVSALDVALTRCGKVVLAEDVKAYRLRNPTFPTTVFTLL